MSQPAWAFEPSRCVRRSDPQTSHTAAKRASSFAESHAGRILLDLQANGPSTAEKISRRTGLTVVQVDRRLPDLKAMGMAEVATENGVDMVHGGFRIWQPVNPRPLHHPPSSAL